jgi:hypothetical protein
MPSAEEKGKVGAYLPIKIQKFGLVQPCLDALPAGSAAFLQVIGFSLKSGCLAHVLPSRQSFCTRATDV